MPLLKDDILELRKKIIEKDFSRMNNMQKAAKNGLLLQSINVPGYQ